MAWSPSSSHTNLVAIGTSTGRTHILNLNPSTLTPAFAGSNPTNTLPSSAVAALSVKHSRPVSSVAFSPHDPSYVATGYERYRYEPALLIWDISDVLVHVPPDTDEVYKRPNDRLGITNPLALSPQNTDQPRYIQQYCASEHVQSVAFLPNLHSTLLASSQNKYIRLFDLRTPTPVKDTTTLGASSMWTTRAVYGVTPCEKDTKFASWENAGAGSIVRLWDSRRPGIEVSSFEVGGEEVAGLSWLPGGGKGVTKLGVATKESIGVWDVVCGKKEETAGSGDAPGSEWIEIGGRRQSESRFLVMAPCPRTSDRDGQS
jgi:WD40 repeat protein